MGRIAQFIKDISASLRKIDEGYLMEIISSKEMEVFYKLRKAEILHCIEVSKKTRQEVMRRKNEFDIGEDEVKDIVRASLFHDIGKIKAPLGPFDKAFAVILSKTYNGGFPYRGKNRFLDIYFNHPEYGEKITRELKSLDGYPYLYDLILLHHREKDFKCKYPDKYEIFRIYKKIDDEC